MTQEELNELIRVKQAKAAEKARAEAQAEYERRQAEQRAPANTIGMGGMQEGQSQADINSQIEVALNQMREKQMKQERENALQEMADSYFSQVSRGKELYDDFDEIMADFDPAEFPEVAALVAQMDNGARVIYELNKSPRKLIDIAMIASRSPARARKEMQKLSKSIEDNLAAAEAEGDAPEPYESARPSPKAGADTGVKSVTDWKKVPYLRG